MRILIMSVAALSLCVPAVAQPLQPNPPIPQQPSQASESLLRVNLPPGVTAAHLGDRSPQVIAVQVMLDRSRHSPGVVDGEMGSNTVRAIRSYQAAHGMSVTGRIDRELLRSLLDTQGGNVFNSYTITRNDVNGPFRDVPDDFAAMARLDWVGYGSALEMLAERFHMDEEFLLALNPGVDFSRPGTRINVAASGRRQASGDIARIEIRKSEGSVIALAQDGNVIASYPATIGSSRFPSPSGSMEVLTVAPEAKYYFDPEGREWGPDEHLEIAAGPNNPVGGIWIDLTRDGYGIHGSADPALVNKTNSHGCVRLTNWDAEELANAVTEGIPVIFV